jgi:CRP-like cAMP-binding protein
MRSVQSGEVLIEQGDASVPFFVVITGEVEILRPFGVRGTLITVHGPSEFTGEYYLILNSLLYLVTSLAALRINSAISFGWDTYDAWLAGSEIVVAFICFANIR